MLTGNDFMIELLDESDIKRVYMKRQIIYVLEIFQLVITKKQKNTMISPEQFFRFYLSLDEYKSVFSNISW